MSQIGLCPYGHAFNGDEPVEGGDIAPLPDGMQVFLDCTHTATKQVSVDEFKETGEPCEGQHRIELTLDSLRAEDGTPIPEGSEEWNYVYSLLKAHFDTLREHHNGDAVGVADEVFMDISTSQNESTYTVWLSDETNERGIVEYKAVYTLQ